jgi:hypothetical protein
MSNYRHAAATLAGLGFILLLASASAGTAPQQDKGYLDYLDSYYQTGNPNDLMLARNAIKVELDSSDALQFQSYYYNAEIQFLLALEELKKDPKNVEGQNKLRGLLLQVYNRFLDAYYKVDPAQLKTSSVPGNTAFLLKDVLMAATFSQNANSFAPIVKTVLRRANRDDLYDRQNSYAASVNDMLEPEYPNLFGIANFVKAVWLNDQFIGMKEEGAVKDSLRRTVNFHAAIASDTLKSPYGLTIAYFLLAETYANHENDMAWNYFKKCLDLMKTIEDVPQGFYARNYNSEIYVATAVAFLPTYAEYLYSAGRYPEIMLSARYLVDLSTLDRGKIENVAKEAVFWGEKSIRALQDASRFASADELFQQLKGFHGLIEPKERLGQTE